MCQTIKALARVGQNWDGLPKIDEIYIYIYRKILVPARIGTHNCNKSVAANCNLSGVFAKIEKSHEIPFTLSCSIHLHPIYHPRGLGIRERADRHCHSYSRLRSGAHQNALFFVLWFRGLTMDICPSFRVHVQLALHDHLPWHLLGARVPSQAMTKPLRKRNGRSISSKRDHFPNGNLPLTQLFLTFGRAHGAPSIGRLGGVGIHNIHHAQTILQHTMPDWSDWMSSESPGIAASTEITSGELSCRWDITIQRLSISLWWRSLLWWPILSKLTMLTSAVLSCSIYLSLGSSL